MAAPVLIFVSTWALAWKHNFIYFWNQPRDGLAASIIAEWQFIVIPHFLVERRLSALQIPQAGLASPARSPHSVLLGSLLTGTAARREADNNNNNCPRTILVALCRQNNGRRYFWQKPDFLLQLCLYYYALLWGTDRLWSKAVSGGFSLCPALHFIASNRDVHLSAVEQGFVESHQGWSNLVWRGASRIIARCLLPHPWRTWCLR